MIELKLTLKGDVTLVECEAANLKQEFPTEDISALLKDLPHLVEAEEHYKTKLKMKESLNQT